ncbi:MAG: hypothetical protein CME71_07590 [Halobacteriovorax sp.]|nr:hypothetical protein [Halobacteriovorax sp.]
MSKVITHQRKFSFPASSVWDVISDTATINRQLKLSPMNFKNIEGVRHGQQKIMGMTLKWSEKPWEWSHGEWLRNERVYSQGFFKRLTGLFEIKSLGHSECEVLVTFTIDHRYPILAWLLNPATKAIIEKIFNQTQANLSNQATKTNLISTSSFEDWVASAHEIERSRISPKIVARETGQTWQDVLVKALALDQKNRFSLFFDAVCPHCRGSKISAPRLTELPKKVPCDSCEITFPIGTQESLEVSLRDTTIPAERLSVDFCSGDVSHRPTVVFQKLGKKWSHQLKLLPGLYNLKKKGELRSILLRATLDSDRDSITLSDLWNASKKESGHILDISCDIEFMAGDLLDSDLVLLESSSIDRGALMATEVMLEPGFSDLIPAESLVSDFPIEVGHRALLFTDVVGSTDLYYEIGDAKAFELVRESFLLIGEAVAKHRGLLVKTIGDATMYSFPGPQAALEAAIEIQKNNKHKPLKLRISLHSGICLSVGTFDGQDFFGDTVNICAKFQSEANAHEIVFAKSLIKDIDHDFWSKWSATSEEISFQLKGKVAREFELLRLKIQ